MGKIEKRYIYGELPKTEFSNNSFDLVLSSHFLFLYSDHLDLDFHINSIKEMLRVGKKVKIFPVYDLKCNKSVHLEPVIKWLKLNGYNYSITKTEYEFQKGVNELLEITKK